LAFHILYEGGRCIPGIDFPSKTLLRIGVALRGTRITLSEISTLSSSQSGQSGASCSRSC
jgi:uncharacterized membrane protein YadS